jgi:hypothetical protein
MANEATIIELFNGGRPMKFTCADNTTIEKGTLLELSGDKTVIANTNANAPLVGIAANEKVASDGSTVISAYTDGIFDVLTDGDTDAAGIVMCNTATENIIGNAAGANLLDGSVLGYLLEEAGAAEVAAVRVNK